MLSQQPLSQAVEQVQKHLSDKKEILSAAQGFEHAVSAIAQLKTGMDPCLHLRADVPSERLLDVERLWQEYVNFKAPPV